MIVLAATLMPSSRSLEPLGKFNDVTFTAASLPPSASLKAKSFSLKV